MIRCGRLIMVGDLVGFNTKFLHEMFNRKRYVALHCSSWLTSRGEIRSWRQSIEKKVLCESFLGLGWRRLSELNFAKGWLSRFVLAIKFLIRRRQRGWGVGSQGEDWQWWRGDAFIGRIVVWENKVLWIHDKENRFPFHRERTLTAIFWLRSLSLPRDSFVGRRIATWRSSPLNNTAFARSKAIASPMTSIAIPTRCVASPLVCHLHRPENQ